MGWLIHVTPRKGPREIFAVGSDLDKGLKLIARQQRLHGCSYLARLNGSRWWTFWKRKRGRIG